MADRPGTPPGLEALASHLGYTFVKKTESSDDENSEKSDSESTEKKVDDSSKNDSDEKKSNEAEKPKVEKGSQNTFGNIYWDSSDETWTGKEPKDTKPAEGEDTAGHAVLVRQTKSEDSRKKYEIHSLIIQSPALKVALGEILDGYPGVSCNLSRLVFYGPFQPFVHRWQALLEYMKKDNLDAVTKDHLKILYDILSKELGDTIKAFDDYVKEGVITYEHAWIIYQPGSIVFSPSGPSACKLTRGSYEENTEDGKFYWLQCEKVEWNGKSFGWCDQYLQVKGFSGVKPISQLAAFPLDFHPKRETIKLNLIERGKRWAALAGYHYRGYEGPAILRTQEGNVLMQTKGRIIIDTDSFCKQWDQCKVYTTSLNVSSTSTESDGDSDDDEDYDNSRSYWNKNNELDLQDDGTSPKGVKLTDEHYMFSSQMLRGYSLKTKKWMQFFIDNVQPIKWDNRAFESLVLPAAQKKLVLALSKTQSATMNSFDDVISGKGKGMILLLSGPPGVGKTLTAEAVSENMKVPLYTMSAGDLGLRPNEVESNLGSVLELVARWKAILLIDECDVFLEARSIHDLERNKLVSIFLRLLEYYQGTLFLTTNRAGNMDPAFQSRIHVHMEYPDLTPKSRKQIWRSFVSQMPSKFGEQELDELAKVKLNGRQIKNVVKTAQLLAMEDADTLKKEHVDCVLAIEKGFTDEEVED